MSLLYEYNGHKGSFLDRMGATITKVGNPEFKNKGKGFGMECTGSEYFYSDTVTGDYDSFLVEFYLNEEVTATTPASYQVLAGLRNTDVYDTLTFGNVTGAMTNETFSIRGRTTSGLANGGTYIVDNISKGYHQIIAIWNGTYYDIWLDGIQRTVYNATNGHARKYITGEVWVGRSKNIATNFFEGNIQSLKIFDHALSTLEVARLYQSFNIRSPYNPPIRGFIDTDITLIERFERLPADGKIIYAPQDWLHGSGTWKIDEDADGKYIENVTAGTLAIQSDRAYGTWEFDFLRDDPTNVVIINIISLSKDNLQDSYAYIFTSDGRVLFRQYSGGVNTNLFGTAAGYINNNVNYSIRTIRTVTGEFSLYIKGGMYIDWTLISPTGGTGTNPTTDNTHTTSKYLVLDFDTGDKIRNIKITD